MKYDTLKEAIKDILMGEEYSSLNEAEAATLQRAAEIAGEKVEAILKKKGYMDKNEKGVIYVEDDRNSAAFYLKFRPIIDTRSKQAMMRAGTDIDKEMKAFEEKLNTLTFLKNHKIYGSWTNVYKGEAGLEKVLKNLDKDGKCTFHFLNVTWTDLTLADTKAKEYEKSDRISEAPKRATSTLKKLLHVIDGLSIDDWYNDSIANPKNIDAFGRFDVKLKKDVMEFIKLAERIKKEHAGKSFK